MLIEYFKELIDLFYKISPFLIIGFLFSGILSVFLTVEKVSSSLGKKNFKSIFLGSLFGVPMPLCSCGVIPVTAYLRKHGASKASSTSFLISTPQTGIDSIMVTYSLLGPLMAIYRPIIAFISGILGGILIQINDKDVQNKQPKITCEDDCCNQYDSNSKIKSILHYGFVRLPLDIINPLIFGLLLSAFVSLQIDPNSLEYIGQGWMGMMIMLFASLPLYICATASIPLAFSFFDAGFSMGAVLVFLMAGPATNITTIAVTLKILGKKSTLIYLFSIIFCALLSGYFLDVIDAQAYVVFTKNIHMHHTYSFSTYVAAGILLFIILNSARIKYLSHKSTISRKDNSSNDVFVDGMTCSHCVDSVKNTLLKLEGINKVDVDLNTGKVSLFGNNFDMESINKSILDLGYKIK